MNRDIEMEAADALLDAGIRLPLFTLRVPFVKRRLEVRVTVRRPCLGSQIRIARLYLETGVTAERMEKFDRHEELAFMAMHGKRVTQMVALTICRGRLTGPLLSGVTAWLLRRLTDDRYLMAANRAIVRGLGTRAFTNIIRSVEAANPLKLRLSQKGARGS